MIKVSSEILLTVLSLPKTPSELKMQRFRAFMRSCCYHDELSFRRFFVAGRLQLSNPRCPASGDPRASSPTHRSPKERAAKAQVCLPPTSLRPLRLIVAGQPRLLRPSKTCFVTLSAASSVNGERRFVTPSLASAGRWRDGPCCSHSKHGTDVTARAPELFTMPSDKSRQRVRCWRSHRSSLFQSWLVRR
jgi:hypothetical protein